MTELASLEVMLDGHVVRVPIGQLTDRIYQAALEVLRERMQLMQGLAQIYVPVDTGSLRDSIRIQWVGSGRRVGTVRAGGYVTNPKTGRLVDYAAIMEQRQPYMRPAYQEAFQEIEMAIKSRVFDRV